MPLVSGPHNSTHSFASGEWLRTTPPMESSAATLGEALLHYGTEFKVSVLPCTKPLPGQTEIKYFEIRTEDGEVEWIVDIHVTRDAVEICPKQDLGFPLLPGDHVEMGPLAC